MVTKEKVKSLLEEILKHDVANLGSKDNEFFLCYTYGSKKQPNGKWKKVMPAWVDKAKKMIKELEKQI